MPAAAIPAPQSCTLYRIVKDHRTNLEAGNADCDIYRFIQRRLMKGEEA